MPELAAVIGFYGILDRRTLRRRRSARARRPTSAAPVLGLFGGADQAIPVEQVEQFDARLTETGLEHEIHVYPGAPHSFFDRRFEDYAEACEDAWRRMLGFLERHTRLLLLALGSPAPASESDFASGRAPRARA